MNWLNEHINTIIHGDSCELIKLIPDKSIDLIITDPPYGKGALLGIEGRIQTRSYDDKDGKRVYVTEVVADSVQFLESKKQAERGVSGTETAPMQNNEFENYASDIQTDDLPF